MRRTATVRWLLIVGLALAPGAVSAATNAKDEKTTVTLIGVDRIGGDADKNFTFLLKQTQTNTNDLVFIMDLAVTSNYDYQGCVRAQGPLAPSISIEVECARDLWVAIVFPDSRLFFFELKAGGTLAMNLVGTMALFPFVDDYNLWPYLMLGAINPIPGFDIKPYPARGHLFALSQAIVNGWPTGRYSVYAGYSIIPRFGIYGDLRNLLADAVSNVDQFDFIIEEATVACGQVQVAGNNEPDFRVVDLGNIGGTFRFDYQTFSQPDRMVLRYEGRILYDTQCVGTNGTRSVLITYHGTTTKVSVQVIPNCAGGTGTAWNYTVHCPVSAPP